MKSLKELIEIKSRFQPHIKSPELIYTYIAPKDRIEYDKFREFVINLPTKSNSIFEILSNERLVTELLVHYFPSDIEFQIYVASNDINSSLMINDTLTEYMKHENIKFNIN